MVTPSASTMAQEFSVWYKPLPLYTTFKHCVKSKHKSKDTSFE